MKQLRGMSKKLSVLRTELIDFASLIEQVDFRKKMLNLQIKTIKTTPLNKSKIEDLINSFEIGNAIKNGIPIVI